MKYAEIRLFWGFLKKLMANNNDEQTCEGPSQPQLGLAQAELNNYKYIKVYINI